MSITYNKKKERLTPIVREHSIEQVSQPPRVSEASQGLADKLPDTASKPPKKTTQKKTKQKQTKQKKKRPESVMLKFFTLAFTALVLYVLFDGWVNRVDERFLPNKGRGLYYGIIGAAMMVLLLLYPVRKHMRFFRKWGRVTYWFRAHMMLGIMAPVLILYHCDFKLGSSWNSFVALMSMFLVVCSGIIGRFIYRQVHNLKNSHHYTYDQMRKVLATEKSIFDQSFKLSDEAISLINNFELYLGKKKGVLAHLISLPIIHMKAKEYSVRLISLIRKQVYSSPEYRNLPRRAKKNMFLEYKVLVDRYFKNIRRAANYSIYEKLFSLWHVLHFPLFILLIFSSALHIIIGFMYGYIQF